MQNISEIFLFCSYRSVCLLAVLIKFLPYYNKRIMPLDKFKILAEMGYIKPFVYLKHK